jgi:hypothetical protein
MQILGAATQNLVYWVTYAQDFYAPVADFTVQRQDH